MAFQADQSEMAIQPVTEQVNHDGVLLSMAQMNEMVVAQDAFASHEQAHALAYRKRLDAFVKNDLDEGLSMFGKKCVRDLKSFQSFIREAEEGEYGQYSTQVRIRTNWGHSQEHRATITVHNGYVEMKVARKEGVNWSKRIVKGTALAVTVIVATIGAHYTYVKQNGGKWTQKERHNSKLSGLYKALNMVTKVVAKPAVAMVSEGGATALDHFADQFF